ncbi:MAG: Hpt domain-containing protein [Magnetococcales bacterium]|nr:Hpt domain-containing protein [Magnetococcales bacterium]
MASSPDRIKVSIDSDLEDITPGYLANRQKDLLNLPEALKNKDFSALQVIGHRMKGSGAGYGFDAITDIGRLIEMAARDQNEADIQKGIDDLRDYLDRVEVTYV